MPYKTRKVRGKNCYKVYKPSDKKVFAKCTTKEKAKRQINLLRAIQNNKNFTPRSKTIVTNGGNRTRKVKRKNRK